MAFVPYHAHLNVQGMAGSKRRVNRYTLESNYIVPCSPLTSALFIYFSIAILKGFALSSATFLSAQLWKDPRVH